jgi:hypothetical protein
LDGACIALGKSLQQVVGTHRAVTGPHQFQYAAPQRRELEAAGGANLLGSRKRIGDAMVVVVPGSRKWGGHGHDSTITVGAGSGNGYVRYP